MAGSLSVPTVTSGTKEVKKVLLVTDSLAEDEAYQRLLKIIQSAMKDEKGLLHLQLFFHLPFDKELDIVHEDPGDFTFLTPPPLSPSRLPVDVYTKVVGEDEGMLKHFWQMVCHLWDHKFVGELGEGVLKKCMEAPLDRKCVVNAYPYIIFMLAKTARKEDGVGGTFYLQQFRTFLQSYLRHEGFDKHEKLPTLFRLIGISLMQPEDLAAAGSDVLELLEEWNYDLTNRVAQETRAYLSEFFKDTYDDGKEIPIKSEILKIIEEAIMDLKVTDDEKRGWKSLKKTSRQTWSEFIAVHAYLTKSLIDKYSSHIDDEIRGRILNLVEEWTVHRPKLIRGDFEGEIGDFTNYYKVLRKFGDKDRDRANMLPKFVEFSYKEVYCSKDGLRIAEKYLIPGGDFDTVSTYILNALDKSRMPEECGGCVPPLTRILIHKLLCSNPEIIKGRREELVPKIFANGAHADLTLTEFSFHMNDLCSKLGTIEREEKPKQLEHNQDLVFSICLQNPPRVSESILRGSLSSKHFKALAFSKSFLVLKSSSSPSSKSVLISSLERITDMADTHDPILPSISESVPFLLKHGIMEGLEIFDFFMEKVNSLLISTTPNLEKAVKLYPVFDSLISYLTEEKDLDLNLLKNVYGFLFRSNKLTFSLTEPGNGRNLFQLRSICDSAMSKVIKAGIVEDPLAKMADKVKNHPEILDKASILQLHNFYMRIPSLRKKVLSVVKTKVSQDHHEEDWNFQDYLLLWIHDSEPEEWPDLLNFLSEILNFKNIDTSKFFGTSLLHAWCNYLSANNQSNLRRYFKFFNKAINFFITKEGLDSTPEQIKIVDSLVILSQEMKESLGRRVSPEEKTAIHNSMQQLFLLLLEIVNLCISLNEDENFQDELLDSVKFLPVTKGGCEPVRKCILDRILNFHKKDNFFMSGGKKEILEVPKLEELLKKQA